jgi:hypothetical protein
MPTSMLDMWVEVEGDFAKFCSAYFGKGRSASTALALGILRDVFEHCHLIDTVGAQKAHKSRRSNRQRMTTLIDIARRSDIAKMVCLALLVCVQKAVEVHDEVTLQMMEGSNGKKLVQRYVLGNIKFLTPHEYWIVEEIMLIQEHAHLYQQKIAPKPGTKLFSNHFEFILVNCSMEYQVKYDDGVKPSWPYIKARYIRSGGTFCEEKDECHEATMTLFFP